jgi:hypothetical protein
MTATLTIRLGDEVIKALRSAKSITVEVGAAGNGRAPRAASERGRDDGGNSFRPGSQRGRMRPLPPRRHPRAGRDEARDGRRAMQRDARVLCVTNPAP